MYVHETKTRVLYADTDKMGVMYYGNYAIMYEKGRTETMRALGVSYRSMEERGCMLPVVSMNARYIKPVIYDDLVTIRTTIKELPSSRIQFFYELFNEENELINQGDTVLAFVDIARNRPTRAPAWFIEMLKPYFQD